MNTPAEFLAIVIVLSLIAVGIYSYFGWDGGFACSYGKTFLVHGANGNCAEQNGCADLRCVKQTQVQRGICEGSVTAVTFSSRFEDVRFPWT